MAARPWADVRRQLQVALRAGAVGALSDGQLLTRFISREEGAELAFETLVARHGPMVLSVCKSLLGASHDVEDAFQATFLVLVRQAESIRKHDSLACWLHGVARRISLRARETAQRRRKREMDRARPEDLGPDDRTDSETIASLHDEIARLPEHYRVAILLCEIAGHTHAEAAARLSCPIGTVSVRVSRAKALLKERIARRGLVASSVGIAAVLRSSAAAAAGFDAVARTASILAPVWSARALAAGYVRSRVLAVATTLAAGLVPPIAAALVWTLAPTETAAPPSNSQAVLGDLAAPNLVEPPAPPVLREKPRPVVMNWREEAIVDVTIAPDGKTFAAVRADNSVTIWDIELDRERVTYRGHAAPVLSLAFSPDGSSVATTDLSREVRVWGTDSGRETVSRTLPSPTAGDPVVAAAPPCEEAPSGA